MQFVKMRDWLIDLWIKGKGPYVVGSLLFLSIFISPAFIDEGLMSEAFLEVLFLVILLAGVYVVPLHVFFKLLTLAFVLLAIGIRIIYEHDRTNILLSMINTTMEITMLSIFTVLMAKRFLIGKSIIKFRLAAAVNIYLFIGLIWGRLYEVIYIFNHAAFSLGNSPENRFTFIYFSFVTLVTLGYGDVVPVDVLARSLAILEGIIGQLYVVILISYLVAELSALTLKSTENLVENETNKNDSL